MRTRIEQNISKAENLENPLESLHSLTTFDTKPKPTNNDKNSSKTASGEQGHCRRFKLQFYRTPLPVDVHASCMHIFEMNMSELYSSSSWGLDLDSKSDEFRHENARFLVVTEIENEQLIGSDFTTMPPLSRSKVCGFSHFRFEVNDDDKPTKEVLYVYEIQVRADAQNCGLGGRLCLLMELIALQTRMKCIMLTVFKKNHQAMNFYLEKMKYLIDESSPSNYEGEEADYEILSKILSPKHG